MFVQWSICVATNVSALCLTYFISTSRPLLCRETVGRQMRNEGDSYMFKDGMISLSTMYNDEPYR